MSELLTLAIETANPSSDRGGKGAGVCVGFRTNLKQEARVLAVEYLRDVERDQDDLLPAIDRAMKAAGKAPRDLQAVAVSVGPGGFTATRMACAAGAMIAEATGAAAIAVPSAAVAWWGLFHQVDRQPQRVAVALAAKGETAWVALSVPDDSWGFREGTIMEAAQLLEARPEMVIADDHLPESMRQALRGAGIPVTPPLFRPEICLDVSRLHRLGTAVDLVPIYPREPEAVTLWRKRHGSVDRPS